MSDEVGTTGGVPLFARAAKDDMYDSEWHDFSLGNGHNGGDEGNDDDRDIVSDVEAMEIDALFAGGGSAAASAQEQLELLEAGGHYRFDPLSPVESRALERALKLSGYIPPSFQEKEEEKRRMMAVQVIASESSVGKEENEKRRKGRRVNAETGKRIYNIAMGATGVVAKENNEAKKVLKTMCENMLPKRHFDWILAQLTYNKCNMLGFDNVPSCQSLAQQAARQSVEEESMPMCNLAYVTKLLAEASKVDTAAYEIIDPTRGQRARGNPATKVKNKMQFQSKAIFEALKQLFPSLFVHNDTELRSNRSSVQRGTAPTALQVAKDEDANGSVSGEAGQSASCREVQPADTAVKHSWQSIFPQLGKKDEKGVLVKPEEEKTSSSSAEVAATEGQRGEGDEAGHPVGKEGQQSEAVGEPLVDCGDALHSVDDEKRKRKAEQDSVDRGIKQVRKDGPDALDTSRAEASAQSEANCDLHSSASVSTRSRRGDACDLRYPLPTFWAK